MPTSNFEKDFGKSLWFCFSFILTQTNRPCIPFFKKPSAYKIKRNKLWDQSLLIWTRKHATSVAIQCHSLLFIPLFVEVTLPYIKGGITTRHLTLTVQLAIGAKMLNFGDKDSP